MRIQGIGDILFGQISDLPRVEVLRDVNEVNERRRSLRETSVSEFENTENRRFSCSRTSSMCNGSKTFEMRTK